MARSKKGQLIKKIKRVIKYEAPVFFVYGAMLVGATTFYMVFKQTWQIDGVDWRWLIVAVPLFGLPKVFNKLKSSKEPYTIQFALAFREGFLSLYGLTSDVFKWVSKVRGNLANLTG